MDVKSKELEVAIKAALEAGKILEKHLEKEILKKVKEDKSIVTLADHESEEIIKKIILAEFPTHSILGEETGMTKNTETHVWHIDPVDGTRNFANGLPLFAISISLVEDNTPRVGVIYNPVTQSLFYAEKGKGAYLNEQKISVSRDDAAQSIVTVSRGKGESNEKLFRMLMHDLPKNVVPSVRDLGCVALDLAYVSCGGFEADILLGLHTYDFAAGALLVLEAGGKITKLDGSPWQFPENYFIASNGLFHDALVAEVKKQKEKLGIL